METTFKTRKKSDTEGYVLVCFNHNYKIIRFSTPYVVALKDWENGYPKLIGATVDLRNNLTIIKQKIDEFINSTISKFDRVPTQNELKEKIKLALGKQEKVDFKFLFQEYLKNKSVSEETIEQINVSFRHLFDLSPNVDFDDINFSFAQKFINHLKKKPLEAVTVNKHLKNIKTFLNWCYSMDHTKDNLSKHFKKLPTQEKEIIALTPEELTLIENSELNARLSGIRDLFLFSCYTGLRYCDTSRFHKDMINDNMIKIQPQRTTSSVNMIKIQQKKTSSFVNIPILNKTRALLEKYNYELPVISNQKANDYLKDLFVELKLNRLIYNEKKKKITPLSEAITFHIGRKSFITLAILAGVNPKVVQKISGHKKTAVFERYISFTSSTLSDELSKMDSQG